MRIFIIIFCLMPFSAFSFTIETVVVGRCTIEAMVTETPQENAQGLLGYTERTFPYGAMLFRMGGRERKTFHTQNMQMTIRIMGVHRASSGNYTVTGGIKKAPPGINQIFIEAPDVLEIPEGKYHLSYKKCLGGVEEP